jgi:hypothetical protein
MRRYVTGRFKNVGHKIGVTIRAAKDGYLGRECPNPKCDEYFKVTPGTGITAPALCHCPYCGNTDDPDAFFTQEQIEYARSVAARGFSDAVHQKLKSMEFSIPARGSFGIGISMKVTPGAPVPIRWYREKNLETEITCDQCGLRYAIYGVFGWCPDCGVHNSLQILGKNLELAKKKLALAESVDKDLAETVIADALAGIVSAFDGFGRAICIDGNTRASFQNLEGGRKRVQQQFGFDMADALTEEEWRSARRSFQKRHLLAHRMGVIDEEYVQKGYDASAVIGRKVMLAPEEVTALVGTVERMGKRLYADVIQRAKAIEGGTTSGSQVDPVSR